MFIAIVLLALTGACLTDAKHRGPGISRNCYSCEFRPGKTRTHSVPVTEVFTSKVARVVTECQTKNQQVGGDRYYRPQYRIVKQCANKIVYDIKTDIKTRNVYSTKTTAAGGFPPCEGPITPESAKKYGIDTWACRANCYSRKDGKGNVFRGCFKGEFGVNPNLLGCNVQAGSTYCFCTGSNCNSSKM